MADTSKIHPVMAQALRPLFIHDEAAKARRAAFERAMSNTGRPGIFNDHNCWRCHDGELPCVQGRSSHCEFPHARND